MRDDQPHKAENTVKCTSNESRSKFPVGGGSLEGKLVARDGVSLSADIAVCTRKGRQIVWTIVTCDRVMVSPYGQCGINASTATIVLILNGSANLQW